MIQKKIFYQKVVDKILENEKEVIRILKKLIEHTSKK